MPTPNTTEPAARQHLFELAPLALRQWLVASGQQRFRADQLLDWMYAKLVTSLDEMTNLSKALRQWLVEHAELYRSTVAAEDVSEDGTRKLLLRWSDGNYVETVWIPEAERHTACISTQAGCPVGCKFCASGTYGLQRDLTAGEIVEQAVRIARLVRDTTADQTNGPARLSHIVVMGMGEPLANYEATVAALRLINDSAGLNIGARRMTLSTIGLPKQIRRLASEGLQINLALSLHAPEDELRAQLIPWGKVPISDLLDACAYYFDKTGREITLEYVLLAGVNDEQHHAARLARLAKKLRCNVNLLRYNPVEGLPFKRPNAQSSYAFQNELRQHGVNSHLRSSRGPDISAACGQLRQRTVESAGE